MTTQAPSCETCGGSSRVMANHFDADRFDVSAPKCTDTIPCPDCQPKPSEGTVSEERVRELRDSHMVKVRHLPPPTLEELTKLLNSTDDLSVQILPTGEVLATTCPDSTTFVAICNELLTARATIERQAGEIKRQQILLTDFHNIDDITRIRELEADLADARLNAFDKAVADELPRVSHLEYDSHEICKHFAAKVRERIAAGDGK